MAYIKKRPDDYRQETLEELEARYNAWLAKYPRRHGRTAKLSDDPVMRRKQIYKNIKSMESRQRAKAVDEWHEKSYVERYGFGNDNADCYGITPKDMRRYLAKFKNCPHGSRVELDYIKRMTGLTLYQIWILQQRTGLSPYPAVTEQVAKRDQKVRDDAGIYV